VGASVLRPLIEANAEDVAGDLAPELHAQFHRCGIGVGDDSGHRAGFPDGTRAGRGG